MAYCEQCGMDRAFCEHGLADRRAAIVSRAPRLLIAPSGKAHFPGCPHKGDDDDYSDWAELDVPDAWQRLGNGEQLRVTGGALPERIATGRCQDCLAHGPWQ